MKKLIGTFFAFAYSEREEKPSLLCGAVDNKIITSILALL